MKTASVHFTSAGTGMPLPAGAGEHVNAAVPAGCILRMSVDLVQWVDVPIPTPFIHEGDDASYRIDCVTYGGAPVTAVLSIGAPQ